MKNLFFLFLSFFFWMISCKSESQKIAERNAVVDSTIKAFQKNLLKNQIDSVFAKNKFNGIVSVMQKNEILYEKSNGFADFKKEIKLDRNTVFAIASVSKQFTAVRILQLQEQGKLRVEDAVYKYLPDFQRPHREKITIHQLLNHTSGLSDFSDQLAFQSGTDYGYSNRGYFYLGEIIAKVSGKSFDQNMQELFTKAGMQHSSTALAFAGNNFASAHTGTLQTAQAVENMPKRLAEKSISTPAGGILSTAADLHLWNQALYSGPLLRQESLALFTKNYSTRSHYVLGDVGYGYGIMMNPETAYFHTGYVKGSPSLLVYYPKSKTSVVILSNFANESRGKYAVFIPHKMIKENMDAVETAVLQTMKKLYNTEKESK